MKNLPGTSCLCLFRMGLFQIFTLTAKLSGALEAARSRFQMPP